MEHLQHFGLNDDPFRHDALERYQIDLPSQHEALRRIDRGVRQTRGLVIVSGGVGSGKSTILRKIYEELEEEIFEASMMLVLRGSVDADWLLQRFASQLGGEEPPAEREALVGRIYERLAIIREDGRHAVLIIDGADALAVSETLSELFNLVKLEYEDRRLLTVILAGSSKLTEAIDADPALAQQVEVRVKLPTFSREEAAGYLGGRVEVAGGAARMLLPGAVAALHDLSDGCPGRLNTLADNAFYESYLAGRSEVAKSDVERACADLNWPTKEDSPIPLVKGRPTVAELSPSPPAYRGVQGGMPQPEVSAPQELLVELDSELEAVFESTASVMPGATQRMDYDAPVDSSAAAPLAHPVPPSTELQLDVLDAPPKDEVDDLFMELLDD